jgi:hypothetical protein
LRFTVNCICLLLLLLTAKLPLHAQPPTADNPIKESLPDAPQPVAATSFDSSATRSRQTRQSTGNTPTRYAPRLARYIEPDEQARQLSAKEKLELSVHQQFRFYAFSTKFLAAGWEQLRNSNPRYGTDSGAFGERLGAAFIRQDSNAFFSDGVFPALLHQDPRFYRLGSGTILHRAVYAATRGIITRTDAGKTAPNYSRFLGAASAYALTMTYYPAVSATWSQTWKGYGVSFLTGALGFELHEFVPDLIHLVRHHHRDQETASSETP